MQVIVEELLACTSRCCTQNQAFNTLTWWCTKPFSSLWCWCHGYCLFQVWTTGMCHANASHPLAWKPSILLEKVNKGRLLGCIAKSFIHDHSCTAMTVKLNANFPDIWIMTSVLAARALCIELPRLVSELNFEYCLNPEIQVGSKSLKFWIKSVWIIPKSFCRIWIMNQIHSWIVWIPKQRGLTFFVECLTSKSNCYNYLLGWKTGTEKRSNDVWMIVYLPRIGLSKPVERLHFIKVECTILCGCECAHFLLAPVSLKIFALMMGWP